MSLNNADRPKVLFLFSDTGGGHRSAAEAIIEAIGLEFPGKISTEMVDIFLACPPPLNLAGPTYPAMAGMPLIWKSTYQMSDGRRRARFIHAAFWPYVRRAAYRLITEHPADLIVSVHPIPNMAILRAMTTKTPYITVVTDMVSTHAMWYDYRADLVIVPNGTIQELGVVYRVARHLGINAITYEFSDQRQRIWLAHNSEIMQQDTDDLWKAYKDQPITEEQMERMRALMMARQRATIWQNFARMWQGTPAQGGEKVREELGLDSRPIVLLATNVLGDSLTLGRDLFADSMTEWITKTVQFFANRPEVQMVIRVHPGEKLVPQAKSMGAVVREALPEIPSHIHIIGALDKINTYDLIEIADLGLAYTTTVGLETAMNGTPVVSCGQTHYRGRGFTIDPNSWDEYFAALEHLLVDLPAHRLSESQTAAAWNYAYRFFFEYPRPFPWRLMNFWDDLQVWPLEKVLSAEGQAEFGETFKLLVGEPFTWSAKSPDFAP